MCLLFLVVRLRYRVGGIFDLGIVESRTATGHLLSLGGDSKSGVLRRPAPAVLVRPTVDHVFNGDIDLQIDIGRDDVQRGGRVGGHWELPLLPPASAPEHGAGGGHDRLSVLLEHRAVLVGG